MAKVLDKKIRHRGTVYTWREFVANVAIAKSVHVQEYASRKICLEYKKLKTPRIFWDLEVEDGCLVDGPKVVWEWADLPVRYDARTA